MTFEKGGDGVLTYGGKLCVPKVDDLNERVTKENPRYRP